ncbi:MAG: hypothetical protein ACYCO9_14020 [Streptosporangiaceae bacterium]
MIPDEWAAELRNLGSDFGDDLGAAAPAGDLGGSLPSPHLRLLQSMNGCTVYHGAFRLFGIGRPEPYSDLASWNASEVWRFAWDDRTDPYLMFGETAWGDQYAYRRGASGDLDQEVYFLEGTLLRPQVIAGSFEDFMVNEFLRNARDPYDELTIEAVQRRGPIDIGNHWVYVPSIALGGTESVDNVIEMPAVTAMTFAGDVASALRASRPGTSPTGVTPWTDDRGRARLKVVFT